MSFLLQHRSSSAGDLPTERSGTWPRGTARHRFALSGLAVALGAAVGAPTIAAAIAASFQLAFEPVLVAAGILVALAFLGAGWRLGRRVDRLTEEARRDPVTRMGNRRQWDESLNEEVVRACAAKMPLSLLMVDIDNMKHLNDVAGHGAGDLALALVGDVLNDSCRSRDVAARFGGDELALLLPRTRAEEARIVAERIRATIAERRRALGAPLDTALSVSIGICDLGSVVEATPTALFEGADRALYLAKENGRDRVEVFQRVVTLPSGVIALDAHRRAKQTRTGR